ARASGGARWQADVRRDRARIVNRIIAILLAAAVAASCASSQAQTRRKRAASTTATAPTDSSKWPLESIVVKGNSKYASQQIIALSGLRIGQQVKKEDF